jgi:hypothetical protein
MLVKQDNQVISSVVDKLFSFVQNDEAINKDFSSISGVSNPVLTTSKAMLPYIFERKIGNEQKSVLEIFEKNNKISKEEKLILGGFKNAYNSVFEIKKVLFNGFELSNLVNESIVRVNVLDKMHNFRGISVGEYLTARIVPLKESNYLFEINEVIPSYLKERAIRLALSKQMEMPEVVYSNNPEKTEEIEQLVKEINKKFKAFFKSNEVITSSDHVDELTDMFNEYLENDLKRNFEEVNKNIVYPEKLGYFNLEEILSSQNDVVKTASEGFSSHNKIYDVGIVCDKTRGLFVVPFLETFNQIFQAENYKSITGHKECLEYYLKSDSVPEFIVKKVFDENPEKVLSVCNKILKEKAKDIEEIFNKYGFCQKTKRKFSSTTILYSSKVFQQLIDISNQENNNTIDKVGRNQPCPCGSGKKYKKCCIS